MRAAIGEWLYIGEQERGEISNTIPVADERGAASAPPHVATDFVTPRNTTRMLLSNRGPQPEGSHVVPCNQLRANDMHNG